MDEVKKLLGELEDVLARYWQIVEPEKASLAKAIELVQAVAKHAIELDAAITDITYRVEDIAAHPALSVPSLTDPIKVHDALSEVASVIAKTPLPESPPAASESSTSSSLAGSASSDVAGGASPKLPAENI